MFGFYDKLTLTACNARDIKGNMLGYIASFPISLKDLEIPDNIVSMNICESIQAVGSPANMNSFKIYIGKKALMSEIFKFEHVVIDDFISLEDSTSEYCYQIHNGVCHVFAEVCDGDIVVDNIDEFKQALLDISYNFRTIQNSADSIKTYSKRYRKYEK